MLFIQKFRKSLLSTIQCSSPKFLLESAFSFPFSWILAAASSSVAALRIVTGCETILERTGAQNATTCHTNAAVINLVIAIWFHTMRPCLCNLLSFCLKFKSDIVFSCTNQFIETQKVSRMSSTRSDTVERMFKFRNQWFANYLIFLTKSQEKLLPTPRQIFVFSLWR